MRLTIETLKKIETEFGSFSVSQVCGGSNDVYLRFGYWEKVDVQKLQNIVDVEGVRITEDDLYDDDCGYLWSYKVK